MHVNHVNDLDLLVGCEDGDGQTSWGVPNSSATMLPYRLRFDDSIVATRGTGFQAGMADTVVWLFDTGVQLFDFVRLFGCSNEGYGLFGSVQALFGSVRVRLCSCSILNVVRLFSAVWNLWPLYDV